ncbi:MAG: manganese efflux pump, partial [Clostridia bacterium]|nr:manganese efflux pump [Clostridia bacterium]
LATFAICFAGVLIGKRFGDKLGNKAVIIGGSILILIGIEICITSFI